jgi:hypothetical protein
VHEPSLVRSALRCPYPGVASSLSRQTQQPLSTLSPACWWKGSGAAWVLGVTVPGRLPARAKAAQRGTGLLRGCSQRRGGRSRPGGSAGPAATRSPFRPRLSLFPSQADISSESRWRVRVFRVTVTLACPSLPSHSHAGVSESSESQSRWRGFRVRFFGCPSESRGDLFRVTRAPPPSLSLVGGVRCRPVCRREQARCSPRGAGCACRLRSLLSCIWTHIPQVALSRRAERAPLGRRDARESLDGLVRAWRS